MNAQQKNDKFQFHDHRDCRHTMVGFLTPEWDQSWGGSLQVQDKEIKFSPGNFVLFSGNDLHDSTRPCTRPAILFNRDAVSTRST